MNKKKQNNNWRKSYSPKIDNKKDKWKFFLIGYIITYIISLCVTGIPKLTYLIPIKLDALIIAILTGALSEIRVKVPNESKIERERRIRWKGVVYGVLVIISVAILALALQVLVKYNVITDIRPFQGMFEAL